MNDDDIAGSDGLIAITMELSTEVLEAFQSTGDRWEERINAALKDWLKHHNPSDVKI
ncbi:BrnA antitoxin family protein [Izhakiella australiensis]|uniref:BrnA antitoxin family protein n=1 Tax=Izhakiella australiensis TaxID=1926881 RepID=UPI00098F5231|nr:BrnA antitoxin family protein [Izhakiella australiensis]